MRIQPIVIIVLLLLTTGITTRAFSAADTRQLVEMPERMRVHQLENMRDHLQAINEILLSMARMIWMAQLPLPNPALV